MEILLVDDEETIRKVLADFLTDCGYEILTAPNGSDALKCLESHPHVDLIISDIRMPKMNGLEFLKAVGIRHPGIPVVLITGHGDERIAVSALQDGAFDYLKKPVKFDDLLDCVERVEARKRLEAQFDKNGNPNIPDGLPKTKPGISVANILVVDPYLETRFELKTILANMGHRVETAVSEDLADARLSESVFDLVICDLDQLEGRGIALIQRIHEQYPTIVPVAMTSCGDQQIAIAALEAGARGFLTKPVTPSDLSKKVSMALHERQRIVETQHLLGDLIHVRSDLREKVVEHERFLNHLIDASPFAILSTDQHGHILTFNGKAEKIYGYGSDEVIGKPLSHIFGPIKASDTTSQDQPNAKMYHQHKNGTRIPVLSYCRNILNDQKQCIAQLYVIEDRTEREHIEEQLLYAERLSMLGQLAPRIAHEFKTPLQIICGNAELATEMIEKGKIDDVPKWLERIPEAADKMLTLVNEMLNLGKPSASQMSPLYLTEEVDLVVNTLSPLGIIKFCSIQRDFPPEIPSIYGDRAQIEQVLRNLIVNAAQAMETSQAQKLKLTVRATDTQHVEVIVEDTGTGIPQKDLDNIFQPFYTTKPKGKGTGLGLPIVKNIVERHDGAIRIKSREGFGTQVIVTFPVDRSHGVVFSEQILSKKEEKSASIPV